MRSKFLSNLFLLLLLNLVVKPFWLLGIDREVQNVLGPEAYGEYFVFLNLAILLSPLLDMGISSYNNRNIAQHDFLLGKYFPKMVNIKLGLSVVYFAVLLVLALLLGYRGEVILLLSVLAFNQVLNSLVLFLRSNLTALLKFRQDSIISVTDKLLLIILCGGLLLYKDGEYLSIGNFVLAQTASFAITVLLAFAFLWKHLEIKKVNFRFQAYLAIIKESYPYAILVLLMAIYSRTDAVMVERLLSDGKLQAGIYAQGYRILEAFSMIAYLFSTLLLPIFAKQIKEKENLSALVLTSVKLIGVFCFSVSVGCAFFSNTIIPLLYDKEVNLAIPVFTGLIFSLIPISSTYIFGTLLTAAGEIKFLNRMAIFGVLLNLALNFILIPHYKAFGAVIATLSTQVLTAVVQLIAAFVKLKLSMRKSAIWRISFFIVTTFALAIAAKQGVGGLLGLALLVIAYPTAGMVLGVLNPKTIIELVKSRREES